MLHTIEVRSASMLLIFSRKHQHTGTLFIFNPLTTIVPHHIETSQLICSANQLTGFDMMATLAFIELRYLF